MAMHKLGIGMAVPSYILISHTLHSLTNASHCKGTMTMTMPLEAVEVKDLSTSLKLKPSHTACAVGLQ